MTEEMMDRNPLAFNGLGHASGLTQFHFDIPPLDVRLHSFFTCNIQWLC